MLKIVLIAVGGAAGALLRYGVAGLTQRVSGSTFPYGTLAVNAIGCLAIGLLAGFFAGPHLVREEYRVAILVGVLGAFTTFSTFGLETLELARDGQFAPAAANILLSNALGLGAVWLGYRASQAWFGV